jgi:aldehyde dehydrogenase (NAD+)
MRTVLSLKLSNRTGGTQVDTIVLGRLSGGERLTDGELGKGFFVPPTVFADVRDDMRIAQEEIFGPAISAIPFTDIEEVIERANKTTFGLGSGVWTRDVGKAHRMARALRAGSVWINCYRQWIRRCRSVATK